MQGTVDNAIRSTALADAKDKIAQNQKKRRDLENDVKDLKVQVGKYQGASSTRSRPTRNTLAPP